MRTPEPSTIRSVAPSTKVIRVKSTFSCRDSDAVVVPHSMSTTPLATASTRFGGGDGHPAHRQVRELQLLLDGHRDLLAEVDRVAGRLPVRAGVGEGEGVLPKADRQGAAVLDLLERARESLRVTVRPERRRHHRQCDHRASLHRSLPGWFVRRLGSGADLVPAVYRLGTVSSNATRAASMRRARSRRPAMMRDVPLPGVPGAGRSFTCGRPLETDGRKAHELEWQGRDRHRRGKRHRQGDGGHAAEERLLRRAGRPSRGGPRAGRQGCRGGGLAGARRAHRRGRSGVRARALRTDQGAVRAARPSVQQRRRQRPRHPAGGPDRTSSGRRSSTST